MFGAPTRTCSRCGKQHSEHLFSTVPERKYWCSHLCMRLDWELEQDKASFRCPDCGGTESFQRSDCMDGDLFCVVCDGGDREQPRRGRLTLAAIEQYVRDGYSLERMLRKYGYIS
jgi:DNA-directed RNA polymerase subunit RPC12/RpoP